ncbi:hypothetical protein OBBRIDRAFT_891512 [Obba rivulosa]|uniref:F-box domain-containing protein n=1 Tax=Obba rivulosa TaxID=1052685 RepID=A0A8E2AK91_9APHY|nr:hypothetical protein OBBRIDRAFT_891512 [Obba rivulosa]
MDVILRRTRSSVIKVLAAFRRSRSNLVCVVCIFVKSLRSFLPAQLRSKATHPRLDFDVLECVLYHAQKKDLYAAALVCREWAFAARRPLYAYVTHDTCHESALLLARTMRTCPHLRPLMRSFELIIDVDDEDSSELDWLHLMPEGGVRELSVIQFSWDNDFTTTILQSPFVKSIRRLKGKSDFVQTKEHLFRCLALPHLEHLSVYVPGELEIMEPI